MNHQMTLSLIILFHYIIIMKPPVVDSAPPGWTHNQLIGTACILLIVFIGGFINSEDDPRILPTASPDIAGLWIKNSCTCIWTELSPCHLKRIAYWKITITSLPLFSLTIIINSKTVQY